ncbi:MAG: crotonase [Proteobacteria bacterium]|nr:MAG: crotonase [Pseudomonadota bacterium]
MSYETLNFEVKGTIGYLTINRPQAMNALNSQVIGELTRFAAEHKKSPLRCIIITGAGDKAFVAGADIKEMESMTESQAAQFAKSGQDAFNGIEGISCPTIAAINGFALGGGMELALSCDIVLASEKAKFGLPEVSLGLLPAFGGTQRLARSAGLFKAREMIFTGGFYSAQDLKDVGIVSKICSPETLLPEAETMAALIATRSPVAVSIAKTAINDGFDRLLKDGLALEVGSFGKLFTTEDQKEGTSAFVAKRKPNFTGK